MFGTQGNVYPDHGCAQQSIATAKDSDHTRRRGRGPLSKREVVELRPGQTWGKFRIVGRLGEGGMATIYLAESTGLAGFRKPVALKLLRSDLAERPSNEW